MPGPAEASKCHHPRRRQKPQVKGCDYQGRISLWRTDGVLVRYIEQNACGQIGKLNHPGCPEIHDGITSLVA